jgi:protein O-mannosyl-transferase
MASRQNKKTTPKPVQAARPAQVKNITAKKQTETKKGISTTVKLAFLLGILSFLVYANTLKNQYALDDFNVIKENTIVTKGASAIWEIFSTPYRRGWFITSNDMYRPLSLVMFAVEYQLSDGKPALGHFMNVLLFAGCVILLFLFLDSLFEKKKPVVAFIAALLFALHPIHTEVVANIKSRDEILCFFFAFLSLNVFVKYLDTGKIKHLALGCLCFFLSLLSKETVITFLGIIPLIFFFYRNENKKRAAYITGGAFAMAVLFLIIRVSILVEFHANNAADVSFIDNMLSGAPTAAARLATETEILGKYILLLFLPYPLVCDYSYNSIPFTGFGNPWVLLSLAAYGLLGFFSVRGLIKSKKNPFVFAAFFFLASISLFSNIPFLIGTPMAERFLFFGSVGFCLAIALAIEKWILRTDNAGLPLLTSSAVIGVAGIIGVIYCVITVNRNSDWYDNLSLFKADINKSPNDSRLAYYYGTELVTVATHEGNPAVSKQELEDGITNLRKSLAIYHIGVQLYHIINYENALSELGNAFFHTNQNDSAEIYDKEALEINPKSSITLNNLAGVYFVTKKYPLALEVCKKSIELNPKYVDAYSNQGLCFLHMGRADSSLFYLYKAMSINPDFKGTYDNFVLTYKALKQPDSVRKYEALAKSK